LALFGLFGAKKEKKQIRCKKGRGNTYEIVGEAFYQPSLLALTGGQKEEFGVKQDVQATLQPEPSNPHDANAVSDLLMGLSAEKKGRSGRGVGAVRIMRQTRRCKIYADRL
jgi:hypothetical protein